MQFAVPCQFRPGSPTLTSYPHLLLYAASHFPSDPPHHRKTLTVKRAAAQKAGGCGASAPLWNCTSGSHAAWRNFGVLGCPGQMATWPLGIRSTFFPAVLLTSYDLAESERAVESLNLQRRSRRAGF